MKTKAIVIAFTLSAMCLMSFLSAATSDDKKEREFFIPAGKEAGALGALDAEDWMPPLFDIDSEGSVYVADPLKARIAIYDKSGVFKRAVATKGGISARLNQFVRLEKGGYACFGDSSLTILKPDGSVAARKSYGYGLIPITLLEYLDYFYIELPKQGESGSQALLVDLDSAESLGVMDASLGKGQGIPVIAAEDGSSLAINLEDMPSVRPQSKGKYVDPALPNKGKGSKLAKMAPDGRSVYVIREAGGAWCSAFSKEGNLIGSAYFPSAVSGFSKLSFAFSKTELLAYRNSLEKNGVRVFANSMPLR